MPTNLKRLVRARMAETGENYTAALRAVRAGDGNARPSDDDGIEARVGYHATFTAEPVAVIRNVDDADAGGEKDRRR